MELDGKNLTLLWKRISQVIPACIEYNTKVCWGGVVSQLNIITAQCILQHLARSSRTQAHNYQSEAYRFLVRIGVTQE